MNRSVPVVAIAGAAVIAALAVRRFRDRDDLGLRTEETYRWHAVTVAGPVEGTPAPLAELGAAVEVRLSPAAGDRGTELAARWRPTGADGQHHGSDRRHTEQLQAALRHAQQLVEVGEVLLVDPRPHGRRRATPTGWLLDRVVARYGGARVS